MTAHLSLTLNDSSSRMDLGSRFFNNLRVMLTGWASHHRNEQRWLPHQSPEDLINSTSHDEDEPDRTLEHV